MRYRLPRAAFSLIELLLVIAILGIVAAVAIPNLGTSLHEELRAVGRIIVSDLAYGQSLAVANNSNYRVQFDLANNRYILEHAGSNQSLNVLPTSAFRSPRDPPTQHIVDLDLLPGMAQAVQLLMVRTSTDGRTLKSLEYDTYGATTEADEIEIWLQTGAGSAARYLSVRVNPVTGLATAGDLQGTAPVKSK